MKPLAEKTIQKLFLKANISQQEQELLHKYLLCFSNLYGCIQIGDLWDVFKLYKEKITKEKFFDFVDIAQRQDNEYEIYNLNEVYSGEESTKTKDKLLVNKFLVGKFFGKYNDIYRLIDNKDFSFGYYQPSKEILFSFVQDQFYESESGQKMVEYINNQKTTGYEYDKFTGRKSEIKDINGKSVKGKFLRKIICYDSLEKTMIQYCQRENEKAYLINLYSISSAEKALNLIKKLLLINDSRAASDTIGTIVEYLSNDLGVEMNIDIANRFLALLVDLSNKSNRWAMLGWSPNELSKNAPKSDGPVKIQIGPNMQKMVDEGKLDLKEMEDYIKDKNYNATIEKQDDDIDDCYEKTIEENNNYLKIFKEYLREKNLRERLINRYSANVDCYLNHYLIIGIPTTMEEGCSFDAINFIESYVNEKVIPADVHNIEFFLSAIELFYKCMLENDKVSSSAFDDLKYYIRECRDEMIEDFYDKNPERIDLYDLMEAIDDANSYGTGYLNVKTGEVEYIPEDEELYYGDIDDLYDKLENPSWVKLPIINDYEIMFGFAQNMTNKKQSDKLLKILKEEQPYSNFIEEVLNMDIEDNYLDYRFSRLEDISKEWMKENCENYYLDDDENEDEFLN